MENISRRDFFKSSVLTLASIQSLNIPFINIKNPIGAHVWVYSANKPNFDCFEVLDTVFSDLKNAGISGVELMERNLRHEKSLVSIHHLIQKYNLPVWGASYNGEFWDKNEINKTLEDLESIVSKLNKLKANMIGISVGHPSNRPKTENEFDTQADALKKVIKFCEGYKITPNLHNHTYEVENNCFDLRNTLSRVPEIKLGPDINWLIRAGINPVDFINEFGEKIVYLHFRDQDKNGKWTETVGEGTTDFNMIMKALKNKKFEGKITLELAYEQGFHPLRALKNDWKLSREFVEKLSM